MLNKFILIGGLFASLLLAGCTSEISNEGDSSGEKYTVDEVEKRDAEVKKEELKKKAEAEADYGKWYEIGDQIGDRVYLIGILGYDDDLVTLQFSDHTFSDADDFTYTFRENRKVFMKALNMDDVEYLIVTDVDINSNKVRLKALYRN